jgi:phosphohistidine phosphatase
MMADGMRLYFLRHGPADRDEYVGDDDDLRPLVERGRQRVRAIADTLAHLDQKIDTAITSPLVRATETAEIVVSRLGLEDRLLVDERLGLELDIQLLASILAGLKNDRRRILLVGHEPSFSTVIGDLTGGMVVMRKGALARVDLTPGEMTRGRLVWLLQPRVLLNLA